MIKTEVLFRPMLDIWEVHWQEGPRLKCKNFPNNLYVREEIAKFKQELERLAELTENKSA